MTLLDLAAFRATQLEMEPFEYCVVPRFLPASTLESVMPDFPAIRQGGSFPLAHLQYGPRFDELCEALRGPEMRDAFAEKFEMDLRDRPTTLTVRGHCRSKDGKIHVDSKSKLITVLIYLNGLGAESGGCLRLLRSGDDLEDYVREVPPAPGTLLCFRNGPTAWHGHASFAGVRQVLQLNWVTDAAAVRKSERRHGLSALWETHQSIPARRVTRP